MTQEDEEEAPWTEVPPMEEEATVVQAAEATVDKEGTLEVEMTPLELELTPLEVEVVPTKEEAVPTEEAGVMPVEVGVPEVGSTPVNTETAPVKEAESPKEEEEVHEAEVLTVVQEAAASSREEPIATGVKEGIIPVVDSEEKVEPEVRLDPPVEESPEVAEEVGMTSVTATPEGSLATEGEAPGVEGNQPVEELPEKEGPGVNTPVGEDDPYALDVEPQVRVSLPPLPIHDATLVKERMEEPTEAPVPWKDESKPVGPERELATRSPRPSRMEEQPTPTMEVNALMDERPSILEPVGL